MHPFTIHSSCGDEEDIKYDNIITTNIDINDNNECVITINALNVHLFDDNEECVICTYDLLEYDVVNTSCCKQKIHKKCIVECFRNSGSCPLCRAKYILKQNLEVTYENYEMKSEVDKKNIESSSATSHNQIIINTNNSNNREYIRYDIKIECICKMLIPTLFCGFILGLLIVLGIIPFFHYSGRHGYKCLDNYTNYTNCTYNKNTTTNSTYNKNLKNLTKF
jgi:hypothetical protein